MIRYNGVVRKIKLDELLYVESKGHLRYILEDGDEFEARGTLKGLEEKFAETLFRIHKRYVVNLSKIKLIDNRKWRVHIVNGDRLEVSYRKRTAVSDTFEVE